MIMQGSKWLISSAVLLSHLNAAPLPVTSESIQQGTSSLSTVQFGPYPNGGMVSEPDQNAIQYLDDGDIKLSKGTRGYLIDNVDETSWSDVQYKKLDLLGKTLSFSVDLSTVPCGCNAAVYLVAMTAPESDSSGYCDIHTSPSCVELDLMEANTNAIQTTVHTAATGPGCDANGCVLNWGKTSTEMYGPSGDHTINTEQPFRVITSFGLDGSMSVSLVQEGLVIPFWANFSSSVLGDNSLDVTSEEIEDAKEQIISSMKDGMVLTASLWGGGSSDAMSWLDGGCSSACSLEDTSYILSDMQIVDTPSPPPSPPPQPPSPPMPPAPPPVPCNNEAWVQCGGDNWTGQTCCPDGYTCALVNEYYSQCILS